MKIMKTRKIFVIAMVAIASAALMGCGSSKQLATTAPANNPLGAARQIDRCEQLAEDMSQFRAHALGRSEKESFAKDKATTLARNELAASIAAGVVSTVNTFNSEVGGEGLSAKDQQDILLNVNEILKGSRTVCSQAYYKADPKNKDKQIVTVSVCVEVGERSIGEMYLKMRGNLLKVQKEQDEFLMRVKESREKYEEKRDKDREATGF